MIELGIIYGIVSMICWGVSDYVCSLAAKKLNPLKMYFWFNLFGTIPLIIMTLFMTGFHIPSNQNMLTYVVVAFGYLFGNLALIKGLKVGKVSIVVPVSSMWPVLIVGFSLFFLGETLNLVNSVAVALIIFSLIIVSITKEKKHLKRKEVVRSLKYATLAALCWGIANSLYVSLARTDGWFWSALIAQVLVIILSFAIILIIKERSYSRTQYNRYYWDHCFFGIWLWFKCT